MLLYFLLCFALTTNGFEVTVCDCKSPTTVGLLKFSDNSCEPVTKTEIENEMEYSVFSQSKAVGKFPAYICARWKNIKIVSTNFFGQIITVRDKIALDTSEEECKIMQQAKRCNDNQMTLYENKWTFNVEPDVYPYWLRTTTVFLIGCTVEEVTLEQEHENESIPTPLGTVLITEAFHSHNHLTIIWDKTYITKESKKARQLEAGIATISKSTTAGIFLLEDRENQLAYHITLKPPNCRNKTCNTFSVIGQDQIYITTKPRMGQPANINHVPTTTTNNSIVLTTEVINTRLTHHIQYINDRATAHENELLRVIKSIQCDLRKAKHQRALSTAQYNGWLAASQLNLKTCTKLSAYGETLVAIKCQPTIVNFTTEVTKCGPQPRFKNYTINLDGWELVNYSPCYWTNGFVNFNNRPHAFRNNSWEEIEEKLEISDLFDVKDSFRYTDINFFEYTHRANPAYTDSMVSHMNIIADIAASMHEHSEITSSGKHEPNAVAILVTASEKSGISTFSGWFEKLKIFIFIVFIIIVALLIARCCYALGCCSMLWTLCCKPPQRPRTRTPPKPTQYHELKNTHTSNV